MSFSHSAQVSREGMYVLVASPLAYQAFFQLLKERGKERRRHKGESGRWKEGGEGGEGEEGAGGGGVLFSFSDS